MSVRGWRAVAVMAGVALLAACGPDGRQVRGEFARRYPNARVLDVFPGQGDTGQVFVNVLYRLPGDTAVHERRLLYRHTDDGWRLEEGRVSNLPRTLTPARRP